MTILKEDAKRLKGLQANFTHEEIAKEMGITRTAVSMLEKSALAKIKRALRARYNIHRSDDVI